MKINTMIKYKGEEKITNFRLQAKLENDFVDLSGHKFSIEDIEEVTKSIS